MNRLLLFIVAMATAFCVYAQKPVNVLVQKTAFRKDTINIVQFGAKSDASSLNTKSINESITAIHKKGGGVVLVPDGTWITGPIDFKSNVNLHLSKNALLIFTSDFSQYPLVLSSFEGVDAARCKSPVTAENLENIAITGKGVINGNGFFWRPVKKDKLTESEWKKHQLKFGGALTEDKKTWYPSKAAAEASTKKDIGKIINGKKVADFESIKDFLRPNMIRISNCKRVLIEGVTFENSPAWTTHLLMSEDITISGLKVKNPWYGANTDAVDLESCKNVLMENCVFDTGDDGITLKSGRDEDGRKRGVPTENVEIRNCTVYHAHGGFVVGSEMSGGVKNIYVSDCTFIGSDIGLRFKTTRGRGGVVENIYVKNINMKDIPGEAILFDMYYAAQDPVAMAGENREPPKVEILPVTEATPVFKNFYFDHIICDGASKGVFIRGIPEMPVENVQMNHLYLKADKAIDIQEAKNIAISNSTFISRETSPVAYILNSSDIKFSNISYPENSELFLLLQGERAARIKLIDLPANRAKKLLTAEFGAAEKSVDVKNLNH
jgi:DNA sulfur modification protein DndE